MNRVIPILGLIVLIMLAVASLVLFSYIFIFGLLLGLLVMAVSYIRFKFFGKPMPFQGKFIRSTTIIDYRKKESGRIIDQDKN